MLFKQVILSQIVEIVIKNRVQTKINDLISEYQNNTGVNIQCNI